MILPWTLTFSKILPLVCLPHHPSATALFLNLVLERRGNLSVTFISVVVMGSPSFKLALSARKDYLAPVGGADRAVLAPLSFGV